MALGLTVAVVTYITLAGLSTFLCLPDNEHQLTNYETLYELGMDGYRTQKYSKCIHFFKKAIEDYHFYTNTVIDCRLRCTNETHAEDELSFHNVLLNANCLRKCKKKAFGGRPEGQVSIITDRKFQDRAPYNYLEFCLFKNGDYKEAAAAAYTYFITHQNDKRTIENLHYYKEMSEVVEKDFVDLERRPYQKAYVKGLVAYNEEKWEDACVHFEESLSTYYVEEERCRAGCEKGLSHGGFPDFVNAIADHYVTVIVCQQKCLKRLSTFGMEELEDFVSEHYNYLQYSYYESKNLKKAFESIANYLLFKPNNQEMLKNKEYYIKTLRHKEEEFTPSETVVEYVKLWQKIDESLDFVREKYLLPNDEVQDDEEQTEKETQSSSSKENNPVSGTDTKIFSDQEGGYMHRFSKIGVRLFAESAQLKGEQRFAADNLIRNDQCESMADLARSKDVYDESKHIRDRGIKQITVAEAIELVEEDNGYEISLRLLLRAGNIMTTYMTQYFNKSKPLVIKELKVICMSEGDNWDVKLLSDCIPQEDGSCLGSSASAENFWLVAYLSDISDGTGQFYFMDDEKNIQTHLQPKCGRIVGFSGKNKHGINMSWKRERCAIVMEMSPNKNDQIPDFVEALDLLSRLEKERVWDEDNIDNSDILNKIYSQGVSIVRTGKDLLGKERFAADGLSTEKECEELIQLAKKEGVSGNGYRGNVSPHTDRELFSGLDMIHAKQKGVVRGDGYENNKSNSPTGTKFVSPYSKNEKFEGLNVTRSVKLVETQSISAHSLQLFLDVSENGRKLVEKYFNLTKPLYFDYTHLVCRTALENVSDGSEELSHPVHSDNCLIQPDGSCVSDPQAYMQRHYSAVMYLNNNFDGGHFFFAHKDMSEQVSLEPKCGRLVAFNAGEFHGVKAVTKGQRCAIAMWYTHDPNFIEVSRMHAQRQLNKLNRKSTVSQSEDVTIISSEEESTGGEEIPPEPLSEYAEGEFHDEL